MNEQMFENDLTKHIYAGRMTVTMNFRYSYMTICVPMQHSDCQATCLID